VLSGAGSLIRAVKPLAGMSILPLVKAPLGVQLNRVAFTVYAAFFAWPPATSLDFTC